MTPIWKKWPITQKLAKLASSAVLPISASMGPIPSSPSGQVTSESVARYARSSLLSCRRRPADSAPGAGSVCRRERCEEAVYVFFGVVEVRRDADALAAHAHEDVLCREPGGEVFRGTGAELQPDHVPRPHLRRDRL